MTQDTQRRFAVPAGLPIPDLDPGTNVMVAGPSGRGARDVALQLVVGEDDGEGALLLSADVSGHSLLERATAVAGPLDRSRIGIIDCAGLPDEQERFAERVRRIEDPGDLTAIEMELSALYETLVARGQDRVRVGLFSVSSMLAHAEFRTVSRFVHMLTGRVIATGDLGVFVVDSAMQDERTVDAIEQFCDGVVDVREGESGFELRVRGFDGRAPETGSDGVPSWEGFALGEA